MRLRAGFMMTAMVDARSRRLIKKYTFNFSQKRACPFGLFLNSMCAWELYMVKKKSKSRNQPERTLGFIGFGDFLVPVAKNMYRCVQNVYRCVQNVYSMCTDMYTEYKGGRRVCPKMCTRCTQLRTCPFAQLVRALG